MNNPIYFWSILDIGKQDMDMEFTGPPETFITDHGPEEPQSSSASLQG